ncbi:hypothetical protein A3K73_00730 [Candidatus Pacearchaeota archaeon RBG_13_36_9]|nr:MAG: hypothetical protein A3K73_00730 [Candidatus Pacearchaeota archaeon RBG_13_36_9]
MPSFKEQLAEKLKDKLSEEELKLLPTGFQTIGEIVILNLKPELSKHEKVIGEAVIELLPRSRTVCVRTGAITGKYREPQLKVIAGKDETETIHLENNCKYKLDIKKLMFAKGNVSERARLSRLVASGEVIVDMFAGIGYFSVPLGKLSKAGKIYSIEWNPDAFYYLNENIKLNKIENVETFFGDNREIVPKLIEKGIKADRIVMGLLPPPKDFIETALSISKKGTIIHYEDILSSDESKREEEIEKTLAYFKEEAGKKGMKVELLHVQRVKGYAPKLEHYVLDIKVI